MSPTTLLRGLTRSHRVGRHWPDTVQRANADYLLSPAAYQLVTRTTEQVHADVDQPTGVLDPAEVRSTNAWTVPPADRAEVLAEMRADLTPPAPMYAALVGPDDAVAAVAIFAEVGCPAIAHPREEQ